MNPFIRKIGFGVLLATLFLPLHSCGLGEDSRDEDNRYVYLRFADPAFEAYCLEHWDLNGDGRISRYEAQRVWDMDCSSLGVKTLAGIEEFTALRKLDCSGNEIVALDVRKCIFMEQLNCSGNDELTIIYDDIEQQIARLVPEILSDSAANQHAIDEIRGQLKGFQQFLSTQLAKAA